MDFPFITLFAQAVSRAFRFGLMCRNFLKDKGQRRTWRKNKEVRVEHHSVEFNQEDFVLYQQYQKDWHEMRSILVEEIEYFDFLIETPVPTEILRYYLGYRADWMWAGWIVCRN